MGEIALKWAERCNLLALHQGLAARAACPGLVVHLVAADVDVLEGEELQVRRQCGRAFCSSLRGPRTRRCPCVFLRKGFPDKPQPPRRCGRGCRFPARCRYAGRPRRPRCRESALAYRSRRSGRTSRRGCVLGSLHSVPRQPPTSVSLGYDLISMRKPSSSLRCQCSRLSLCMAMRSMSRLTNSSPRKCRESSSMNPRQREPRLIDDLAAGDFPLRRLFARSLRRFAPAAIAAAFACRRTRRRARRHGFDCSGVTLSR